jgi:hypothetical protein
MFDLDPGDVLSYSAGSTQTGPEGYRKVRPKPGMLAAALKRWPEIAAMLSERAPLYINAYPATVGTPSTAISVDTYVSPRVLGRALQLGAVTERPTILAGQSLFLADALLQHVGANRALPKSMLIVIGGYTTPRVCEQLLIELLAPVSTLVILQAYGVAEVDAGCMVARERDAAGRLVFYPRDDVTAELDDNELLLSLRDADGRLVVERWHTGDSAARSGEGWAVWNDRRLHPIVAAALDSWTTADWRRRTGYVRRDEQTVWMQLRQDLSPAHVHELDYWEFGRKFGFSWLDKPFWR